MTPRKDRGPEAQARANALSVQLKVSMHTAWKYFDEANADRIAAEDEAFEIITSLRTQGHDDAAIAAMFGISQDGLAAFLAEMAEAHAEKPSRAPEGAAG